MQPNARSTTLFKRPHTCNVIRKWLQHRCFPVKFYRFYRTLPVAASNTCLVKTTTFFTMPLLQRAAKTQFWTLAPGSIFFLEILFTGSISTLKIKPEFFWHFCIFFSIYADHAFLAKRAKYPSYCYFEKIYQNMNVMKSLFPMQYVWSCHKHEKNCKKCHQRV